MIDKFVSKFTEEKFKFIEMDGRFFLADDELLKVREEVGGKPISVGLPMGEVKKGKFTPSVALLHVLSQRSNEKVFVKDIGEIEFIYGKNLKARHVDKVDGSSKEGFLKLVVNKHGDCLGYGKIVGSLDGGKFLRNLLDVGDFLRRER